jgi:uncharacterized membrane protein YdjX (TVP38/TMEM64 family)
MAKKLVFLGVLVAVVLIAWNVFDLGQYLNFYYIQGHAPYWKAQLEQQPLLFGAIFFVVYVLVTGLSIPGAAVMTLLAGALFGVVWGTVLVSFASTLGATLAFLIARFVARDFVQQRFAEQLKTLNDGVEKEGGFYLFTLRLVPAFPFFLINIAMGLTPIKVWQFYWISQVGMLAGTIVYVNAGTQLAQLESMKGILSPALIGSFVALGLLPLVAKKTVAWLRTKRAHA